MGYRSREGERESGRERGSEDTGTVERAEKGLTHGLSFRHVLLSRYCPFARDISISIPVIRASERHGVPCQGQMDAGWLARWHAGMVTVAGTTRAPPSPCPSRVSPFYERKGQDPLDLGRTLRSLALTSRSSSTRFPFSCWFIAFMMWDKRSRQFGTLFPFKQFRPYLLYRKQHRFAHTKGDEAELQKRRRGGQRRKVFRFYGPVGLGGAPPFCKDVIPLASEPLATLAATYVRRFLFLFSW